MILQIVGMVVILAVSGLALTCISAGTLYMLNVCKEYWDDFNDA